jgi:hypothetical protein
MHSAAESRQLNRLIGVYLGDDCLKSEDVDVYPVSEFCKLLYDGVLLV